MAGITTRRNGPSGSEKALMPTVANGIDMDPHIAHARAVNLELELRPVIGLAVRLLGYSPRRLALGRIIFRG
jgi:hypothetical protein